MRRIKKIILRLKGHKHKYFILMYEYRKCNSKEIVFTLTVQTQKETSENKRQKNTINK